MKFLRNLIILIILILIAAAGYYIYTHGLAKSRERLQHLIFEFGNSLSAKKTTTSAPASTPTPAPSPVAEATPAPAGNVQLLTSIIQQNKSSRTTDSHQPENHHATSGEDPNRAEILTSLQSSRAEWPLRIANKIPIQVPLVAQGRVIGEMKAAAGSQLAIVAVRGDTVTVDYQGGTKEMAVSDTDLIARVEELRKYRRSAAATPAPLRTPRPTPPPSGLDSTAPGVNPKSHYFGVSGDK